jgi:hypothetical protein
MYINKLRFFCQVYLLFNVVSYLYPVSTISFDLTKTAYKKEHAQQGPSQAAQPGAGGKSPLETNNDTHADGYYQVQYWFR